MTSKSKIALPQGEGLPKQYTPTDHEARIWDRWADSGVFSADPARVLDEGRPSYAILIPPPNVTARLHLGHALNNSLQDILIRAHRMKGFETLWMPGTDHAGIATQTIVDKRLTEAGEPALRDYKTMDGGREKFIEKVQAFKDEFEAVITNQLQRMGCSCDWDRQRFTMDEVCARAVREAFFRLFSEGLIYRGKRLVNWDPVTQTALADDEVEMKEVEGSFWYLRYPLVHRAAAGDHNPVTWGELATRGYPGATDHPDDDQAWVTVATTRPETYLGDTAVAINPDDPRAKPLQGFFAELPIVGRVIPIIEDDYVVLPDPESSDPKAQYATGFLKVTPAHDPNDWDLGRRHDDLEVINVMAPDASISDQHGWDREGRREGGHIFVGKSREDARELVVREFQSHAIGTEHLLEAVKPYSHSVGHSYRSHAMIEPYLSDQWYVKVSDDSLVGEAQRAMSPSQRSTDTYRTRHDGTNDRRGDGELQFHPERYAKTYESWHDNLRDWCISRQLWWGHRIPVWSRTNMSAEQREAAHLLLNTLTDTETVAWQESSLPDGSWSMHVCWRQALQEKGQEELAKLQFTRDPDVLDTWFSSALWPLSTMGWPDPEQDPQLDGLLDAFNPTSVLCTGRDIITLWVSRMVMFNRHLLDGNDEAAGRLPFNDVYIHPIIQDGHGQRMSKSLGNGVDPLDIISTHGADAMRFVLAGIATATQDVRMPVDLVCPHCSATFEPKWVTSPAGYQVASPEQTCPKCSKSMVTSYGVASGKVQVRDNAPLAGNTSSRFDDGQKFCNKLWNAARFAMMMLGDAPTTAADAPVAHDDLSLVDRWMLSRLARATGQLDDALGSYQFSVYASTCYDLLWRDFCDWYLESIKRTVKDDPGQRAVLRATLDAILRLLHPVIPFVTEAIYEQVRTIDAPSIEHLGLDASDDLLAGAAWPQPAGALIDPDAEAAYERIQALVKEIRDVRAQHRVPPSRRITLHATPELAAQLAGVGPLVETLANIEEIAGPEPAPGAVAFRHEDVELHVSNLADAVDSGAERERLAKQVEELDKSVRALEGRLNNPGYTQKAPEKLVNQTREQLEKAKADRQAAAEALERLG